MTQARTSIQWIRQRKHGAGKHTAGKYRLGQHSTARALAIVALLMMPGAADAETAPLPTAAHVLERYAVARGGADRWAAVQALEWTGIHATFSEKHPFTLIQARPNRYRFDFTMLGNAATKARDAGGVWWTYPLLGVTEATRLDEGPYRAQIERASWFAPPLIGAPDNGVAVVVRGYTDLDGLSTLQLDITLPDGAEETWYLDPGTFLEVAIDSQVFDHTQGPQPMPQRAFVSNFKTVSGLVLPHRLDLEFGARLEVTEVTSVILRDTIDDARFVGPPPPGE